MSRWLFVLPLITINLIVIVIPSIQGLFYSLTKWNGIGESTFVGIGNFLELLDDRIFLIAFKNNIIYTIIFVTATVIIGLLVANQLANVKSGQIFYRLSFFIPYIIAVVITTQIWRFLYHPKHGIGANLAEIGLDIFNFSVLGDKSTALYGVLLADGWKSWGFLVVIYLAAMTSIDRDLYDSAKIDGANKFQTFKHVTIPSIRPTIIFTLIISFINSTLVFDHIYMLTGGGPARSSEVLATYLYEKAFEDFNVGYAAAIGVMLALWVSIPILMFYYLRRRGWEI